jgi:hypothetical protein
MKICTRALADAQMEIADFLSLLWEIKEHPSDWLQKYRDEMRNFMDRKAVPR